MDTFLGNLLYHIPGHKVPDLKVKIFLKREDEPKLYTLIS